MAAPDWEKVREEAAMDAYVQILEMNRTYLPTSEVYKNRLHDILMEMAQEIERPITSHYIQEGFRTANRQSALVFTSVLAGYEVARRDTQTEEKGAE